MATNQNYKVFSVFWIKVKFYSQSFMVVWVVMTFWGCDHSRQSFHATDAFVMKTLHHYFDQEKEWLHAIKQNDSSGAYAAVDSMSQVLSCFDMVFVDYYLSPQDSMYLESVTRLYLELQKQNKNVFPVATALAFIPEPGYTVEVNAELMKLLKKTDSISQQKLGAFHEVRNQFLARYHPTY